MLKPIFIGALAPLLLLGVPARADWRSPISGGRPILQSAFTPQRYEVLGPIASPSTVPVSPKLLPDTPPRLMPAPDKQIIWNLPLVDRKPSAPEKAADLTLELQDAILRIEPIYDPTRLDGPDTFKPMVVTAGTAAMNNVFADHWRLASPDANVNVRTTYLATAWSMRGVEPCDAFTKTRAHDVGEPALTALDSDDCQALLRRQSRGFAEGPPVPIVFATLAVPVFAAPLPGSRMTSEDFWASRKTRINAIQANLQRKWEAGAYQPTDEGAR